MPQNSLHIAKTDILQFFERTAIKRVFTKREITDILEQNRRTWRVARSTKTDAFLKFLMESGSMTLTILGSDQYGNVSRYTWGTVSPYDLALSIRPNSYLSHASAVYLHGLTEQLPRTIYVNKEQSEKPRTAQGHVTQEALDRAFKNNQRVSRYIYSLGDNRIVLLSGKQTNNLGVIDLTRPEGELRVTNLERTLIDISVRPVYAGGPHQVLLAFRAAREIVSVNALVAMLKKLGYVYPYSQNIGFYMDKAGYEESRLRRLKTMISPLDFYLMHGLKEKEYDPEWRLFYPKGFQTGNLK